MIKNLIKNMLNTLGIHLTKNQRYDAHLNKIIDQLQSNKPSISLIDIGAHKGEVTDYSLKRNNGYHLLFEPIPVLYKSLKSKYENRNNVVVYNLALSQSKETSSFQWNHSHPAYSGLRQRAYPTQEEKIEEIEVQTDALDNVLKTNHTNQAIDLIKIDVEGGELNVLKGATETIRTHKPFIVFEHGLGASDYYNTTPKEVFELLTDLGMQIQTMENWLTKKAPSLELEAFESQFYNKENYYFIAYS